jgi:hypothetical protein
MDIIYNWEFNPLEAYPTASGETDVVFLVHWQANAMTGSYSSTSIGTQPINYLSGSTFIPFNELTKDIVFGWFTASIGDESYNRILQNLEKNIQDQITPQVIVQKSPWI